MWKAVGSYRTYSSLVKLQPWFLKFAVEDLPLSIIAVSVHEFAVKDCPSAEHSDDYLLKS